MSVTEHVLSFIRSFTEGGVTAECSCGWEGQRRMTDGAAREDWENHCEVVFMEATGG